LPPSLTLPTTILMVSYCLRTADKAPVVLVGGFPFLRILQVKERADERTRNALLLITSEKLGVAGHCSGLLWLAESPYLSGIFFTGLHTVA
jgi:hypothetical protein